MTNQTKKPATARKPRGARPAASRSRKPATRKPRPLLNAEAANGLSIDTSAAEAVVNVPAPVEDATVEHEPAKAPVRRGRKPKAATTEAKPADEAVVPAASPETVETVPETAPEAAPNPPSPSQPAPEEPGVSASISGDPADLLPGTDEPEPSLADEEGDDFDEEVDFDALRTRLMALQQQLRAAKVPVVIVFEGWSAAGKGSMMSKLVAGLDPRGYTVYPIRCPTDEERRYPMLRRYWVRMPEQGHVSVFCSSWYREVTEACMEEKSARKQLALRYEQIVQMESQLVADGAVIIKFFLHIPRKEQKKRLKALESKKNTRWRVTREDWEQNERYEEYLQLYDAMIARTHFDGALWHVVHSENKRRCLKRIYDVTLDAFEKAVADRAAGLRAWDTPFLPHTEAIKPLPFPQLYAFEPDQPPVENYKETLDKLQKRLRKLQNELFRRRIPLVLGFEGWDAAGKGGAIRRLMGAMDARSCTVSPTASPTPVEKAHHHLWRFWEAVPADGCVTIFDRTWYGRLMVERIEGFCTENQWKRGYEELNRFELELARHGAIVRKFWLQIDNAEQLRRFTERQNTPEKQWKITDEDWRNRDKWPLYETAVNDMLQRTHTAYAPWVVVEANNKQFARVKVLREVVAAIEERLGEED